MTRWKHVSITACLLSLWIIQGCRQQPSLQPVNAQEPAVSANPDTNELISSALKALKVSGIPEPPLSPKSTRTQRQEYLLATEEALSNLRKLPSAPAARVVTSPSLLPENRGDEILAISRLLAVDLADAIDRSNPGRAEATLRVAMRYADMVSCESVSSWVTAGAVSDSLAQGIKSVGRQLDSKMTDTLRRVIDEVDKKPPNSSKAIEGTMARMSAWQTNLQKETKPIRVEQVLHLAGGDPNSRVAESPGLRTAVAKLAKNGEVSAATVASEGKLVVDEVEKFLHSRQKLAMPDVKQHPMAALYLSLVRPTIEAAPDLAEIRQENLRLLSLTVRLLTAESPTELGSFGKDAMSPVSGMKFEYKKTTDGFELVRPRPKGKAA